MLGWRLTLGTLLVAVLIALCALDAKASRPGVFLAPLAIVVCIGASGELLRMFRASGKSVSSLSIYGGPIVAVGAACIPIVAPQHVFGAGNDLAWLAIGLAASTIYVCIVEMRRYTEPGGSAVNIGLACLSTLYVGGLLGMFIPLRLLRLGGSSPSLAPLAGMIALVKLSDTSQYFVGKALGRHKLAPMLSPGKTWEGAIGGVAVAVLAGALLAATALPDVFVSTFGAVLHGAAFGLCVAVAGLTGDLAESLLKRDAGVKDSSTWLPGFGGVLDMIDSLLFAAPAAYVYLALVASG